MGYLRSLSRALGTAIIVVSVVSACGGSHSALPTIANEGQRAANVRPAATTPSANIYINAGGAASGSFVADEDYTGTGTSTYAVTNAITTSGVTNPAPQAVYQTERYGQTFAYVIPGLVAGASYTVRLDLAENYWTAAGKRIFSVKINSVPVLTNFDIYATAGARFKAIAESFTTNADSTGKITIGFTTAVDNAKIDGIEITSGSGTPTPTAPPTSQPSGSVWIDAGGPAAGNFGADEDYTGTGTSTYTVTNAITTSGITNPAPQSVYQSERYGQTFSYVIPGLVAGATYNVRLDLSENYWSAAGQRVFSVKINSVPALTNFDIYATAGARFKAIAESFTSTADTTGTITIGFTTSVDNAKIDGIEITPGTSSPTPTPTPTVAPSVSFNDYSTYGYDNARDVFNPNSVAITPGSVPSIHLAWQSTLGGGDYNTQAQPVLATEIPGHQGVLFVDGSTGNVYAYDALTGALIWTRSTGQMQYACGGSTAFFGAGGTAAYDPASKSLYVMGNTNSSPDAYGSNSLIHLDAATGNVLGQVNVAPTAAGPGEIDFAHTAVTLSGGIAYVGTGSTCDISSWRGRVVAVNVPSMTIANTFLTLWDPNNARGQGAQPWSGGGVWGWGGVSLDGSGNVLTGVGNADVGTGYGTIQSPFHVAPQEYSGYAETLLELNSSISTVVAANHPIPTGTYNSQANDLDVQGTPLVLTPSGAGCGTMVAIQGKSGEFSLYNESRIANGPAAQYQLSPLTSDANDAYLGDPAYSPGTGYVYAPVASSVSPTLFAPGLIAVNPSCGSPYVAWHAAFGSDSSASNIPRSVPAASAGGVVFAGSASGSGSALWAINASTGTVLNGGVPILQTSGPLRVPPTIDGNWIYVLDNNGDMYGLTIDPSYKAIAAKRRALDARVLIHWGSKKM